MSLINLQTGATAAEEMRSEQSEKIILDLQTRIYKQDLLIRKLNEEADRLHSQNQNSGSLRKEIELLKSKLTESESVGKELGETVTRVNNENAELKSENQKLKNRPPQTIIRYEKNCYRCSREEYEKAAQEMEDDKKAAKENRDYFYRLVNNYNAEIDKRVDKIVKQKTAFQRFADWLETSGELFAGVHFFFPFFYSLTVTIIQIIRTDIVRTDFINAIFAIGKAFAAAFNGIKWLICKAAGVSEFIPNEVIQNILWWVIVILLTLIISALILAVTFIVGFFTIEFAKFLCDKLFLSVMLADLVIVTFLGDIVKMISPLNLVLTFFILLLAFIVIRITVSTIIEKIEGRE